MRRYLFAATAMAFAGAGCGKPDPSTFAVVRIADRGFLTTAPIYIAEEEGYFADERIKLEFSEPPRSSAQIIPLLERGDIDLLASGLSAAFYSAVLQGSRSRMVADRGHASPAGCDYDGLIVRRGLFKGTVPTAKDLQGKRFSGSGASSAGYIVDKYLRSLGLTNADIDLVRLGETVETQALRAGSIDGMHVAEPNLSSLVAEGHKLIAPARVYAPQTHYAIVVFGPSLTVTRRDVGQRFMKAYLRGVRQFNEGLTDRNVEIMARRTHVAADKLRKVCLPTINPDGAINFPSMLDFQEWLVAGGNLTRVLGPEAGTDMSFARNAAKELGIPPTPR